MTVGESIRHHRKKLGLTQAQLADRVGVSTQAVSKWENNVGLPDISMAVPLARALGTTTDELLRFGERYQEFEERWKLTLRTCGDDPEKLLEVSLAALREFPWDKTFRYRAAVDQQRLAETVEDPRRSREYIGQALANAQLHLEMAPDSQVAQEHLRLLRSMVVPDGDGYVLRKFKKEVP